MISKLLIPALAGSLLVAGCVYVPLGSIPKFATGSVANGTSELQLKAQIQAGGLSVQTVVNNYTATDVDHLVVKLFKVNGNTEDPVNDAQGNQVVRSVAGASLSNPIAFSKLHANTTYRIRSFAYVVAAESTASLISSSDAKSYVDVTLTNDDRPTIANLKVKLIDKAFSGEATASGVVVENGGLVTDGSESVN